MLEIRDIIKGVEADPRLLKSTQVDTLYAALKESEKRLDNDAILAAAMSERKKVILPLFFALGNPVGRGMEIPDYLKLNSLAASSPGQAKHRWRQKGRDRADG